jgi:hypothetical protein
MLGWGLHYLDPFGFAYTDEAGNLVGVASEHGHMFGYNRPIIRDTTQNNKILSIESK